jgi:hypothetical protein
MNRSRARSAGIAGCRQTSISVMTVAASSASLAAARARSSSTPTSRPSRSTNSAVTCFSAATFRAAAIDRRSGTAGIVSVRRSPTRGSVCFRTMAAIS